MTSLLSDSMVFVVQIALRISGGYSNLVRRFDRYAAQVNPTLSHPGPDIVLRPPGRGVT